MSNHYMRSSVCGLTFPGSISPSRLSHEDEDPSLRILADDIPYQPQYRFRPLRHGKSISLPPPSSHILTDTKQSERPISSASSRSSTASKSYTQLRSITSILESKAKKLLAQFSSNHNHSPSSSFSTNRTRTRPTTPPPSTLNAIPLTTNREEKRISRTLNYIRHGTPEPEYEVLDVSSPVVLRANPRSSVRSSVYSSHCLVSGSAANRSSRYFQM